MSFCSFVRLIEGSIICDKVESRDMGGACVNLHCAQDRKLMFRFKYYVVKKVIALNVPTSLSELALTPGFVFSHTPIPSLTFHTHMPRNQSH
jgi:hypothetical protein